MVANAYSIPGIKLSDDHIIEAVCRVYNVNPKNLLVTSRKRRVVEQRQIAIFLIIVIGRKGPAYIEQKYTYDHSTAHYSINVVKALYQASLAYRMRMAAIFDDLALPMEERQIINKFLWLKITWGDFKQNYIQPKKNKDENPDSCR